MNLSELSSIESEEINQIKGLITSISEWLDSFKGNNNTGINEEKKTGIAILLRSGLDNINNLPSEYKDVISLPKINGISGLINVTQSDNTGGTGDMGIVYNNGETQYFSVTQWKGQYYKKKTKCICNPSAIEWYKLERNDEIEQMNEIAFQKAINYRKERFGPIPSAKWKRTPKCPGGKLMAEFLSKKASELWNTNMKREDKINSIKHFLDLDEKLTPNAEGIIYWDNKSNSIKGTYKWELKIKIEDYLDSFSDGNYIYHGKSDDFILKTQAKYNNGIIEGMSSKHPPTIWKPRKSSNYLTSWNTVADLEKIFKMTTITL